MIKDFSSKEVVSSVLNKKLIKHNNHDYPFISLFGHFFITADRFLPICADYFCTSTDLFGFYEKPKYKHLLTEEFYNFLNINSNIIEINVPPEYSGLIYSEYIKILPSIVFCSIYDLS